MGKKVDMPEVMDPRFVEWTPVELNGTEGKYFHLINPDTGKKGDGGFAKNPEWAVHVKLSEEAARAMKKIGFNVQEDDADNTFWLRVKRICVTRAGKKQDPPRITTVDGSPVTDDPGNGTTMNIKLSCKYSDPIQGKIHMLAYIDRVDLLNIVERESSAEAVKF